MAGTALLVTLALTTAGCRTYFGYDDYVDDDKENTVTSERTVQNQDYHQILTVSEYGTASLHCFSRWEEQYTESYNTYIKGRIDYYADHYSDFWFDDGVINPLQFYDSQVAKSWECSILRTFWTNEDMNGLQKSAVTILFYPVVWGFFGADLLFTPLNDAYFGFVFTLPVDLVVYPLGGVWTPVSGFCHWMGGRLLWWGTDWNYREHSPNIFRQITYWPVINFFFPFQTPPYMVQKYRIHGEKEIFDEEDWELVRENVNTVTERKQKDLPSEKVTASILSKDGKQSYCAQEFTTDENGNIDLTAFMRDAVQSGTLPEGVQTFTLRIALSSVAKDKDFVRTFELQRKSFMTDETLLNKSLHDQTPDFSQKMQLRKKNHKAWGEALFDDQQFLDLEKRVRTTLEQRKK